VGLSHIVWFSRFTGIVQSSVAPARCLVGRRSRCFGGVAAPQKVREDNPPVNLELVPPNPGRCALDEHGLTQAGDALTLTAPWDGPTLVTLLFISVGKDTTPF